MHAKMSLALLLNARDHDIRIMNFQTPDFLEGADAGRAAILQKDARCAVHYQYLLLMSLVDIALRSAC